MTKKYRDEETQGGLPLNGQAFESQLPVHKKQGKVKLNPSALITVLLLIAIAVVAVLIVRDILHKRTAQPQIIEMNVPHSGGSAVSGAADVETTPLPLRPESAGEGLLPVFYGANTEEKKLAVTLSGSINESQMGKLVAAASAVGGKLTFFPTGEALEKNVPMWAQVNLMGHEIETSGYSGKRFLEMDGISGIAADLDRACAALSDWINADYKLHFIRTGDLYDDEYLLLHRALSERGFYGVARQSLQLSKQVTDADIRPGMILNMEIGALSADDLCRYIEHLSSLGYSLVTMNELFEYPPNYVSSAGNEG